MANPDTSAAVAADSEVENVVPLAPRALRPLDVIQQALETIEATARDSVPHTNHVERVLKAGPGAEAMMALVMRVAKEHGMQIPVAPVEEVEQNIADEAQLRALRYLSAALALHLQRGHLITRGKAWSQCLAYYRALSGFARLNPSLHRALEPMRAYLAHGKRATPPEEEKA